MNRKEQSLQSTICTWMKLQHPSIRFKVDHGASQHKPSMIERQIYAKQQWKPGYPDFQVIKATDYYFGLFLELKGCKDDLFNKNGTAKRGSDDHIVEQYRYIQGLLKDGYHAQFVWDIDQACQVISKYLRNEPMPLQIISFNSMTKFEKSDIQADEFFNKFSL